MKKNDQLERIQAAALARYADIADVCVRNALKRWREEHVDNDAEPLGDLAHTMTSTELEKLAIEWNVADIEENIAIERARLAGIHVDQVRAQFTSALAEVEGIYANSDEMKVVISRMEVWKVDEKAIRAALPRKVVDFTRAVVAGTVPLAELKKDRIPPEFKEIRLISDYVKDLADFLLRTGEEGQALLKNICDDMESAVSLVKNGFPDTMPECDRTPLQFLAKQVMDTRTAQAALRSKPRSFGFCAG